MCNDVATKDDQYKSAQEARNDYFANLFNVQFEDREAKLARRWAELREAQKDPEAARARHFESLHDVLQEDRDGKVAKAHKEQNRKAVVRDGKERSPCHLVQDHGPSLSEVQMKELAREKAEKYNNRNAKNSKFNTERDMWGARHHFCAMYRDEMAEIAKTAKNGTPFALTVDCAHLVESSIGEVHFADGRSSVQVTNVYFAFEFYDGKWYELTGFPKP